MSEFLLLTLLARGLARESYPDFAISLDLVGLIVVVGASLAPICFFAWFDNRIRDVTKIAGFFTLLLFVSLLRYFCVGFEQINGDEFDRHGTIIMRILFSSGPYSSDVITEIVLLTCVNLISWTIALFRGIKVLRNQPTPAA